MNYRMIFIGIAFVLSTALEAKPSVSFELLWEYDNFTFLINNIPLYDRNEQKLRAQMLKMKQLILETDKKTIEEYKKARATLLQVQNTTENKER